ncbi:MAG TPA: DUF433 domain-containing protein [Tepidisphaeraceae bacterium]|jgi:uncharacterized protein (DUF433 family)
MSTATEHRRAPRPDRDLLPEDTLLGRFIWVNPARMSGEPCFRGTRVPVQILFDHLRMGDPLDEFLDGFPDVSRESAVAVIDLAAMGMLEALRRL